MQITEELYREGYVQNVLKWIENKSGVKREYVVYGLGSTFGIYLVVGHFAELICNFVGVAYPAYSSIKAIQSSDKQDDTQWLIYWVVFAVLSLIDFASEKICGWFPLVRKIYDVFLNITL